MDLHQFRTHYIPYHFTAKGHVDTTPPSQLKGNPVIVFPDPSPLIMRLVNYIISQTIERSNI